MPVSTIPSNKAVLTSLLKADFITQWRNRRAVILILLIPAVIIFAWKGFIPTFGGAFILSNCITVGLNAIGLMGYSNSVARDRDKGIFQRLRVAPLTAWPIMASRLMVQLAMIMVLTISVFIIGKYADGISLSPLGYAVCFAMAFVGGSVYLALGQAIVGLLKNAETVNAVTRLVYFLFIMIGMVGSLGRLGDWIENIAKWSPYGTVQTILAAGMRPETWNQHTSMALFVTIGYTIVFSILGIKWFKWSSK